ncbi:MULTISPECIES: hypothetical protein [Paenibacillus]|uniref:hypothetical protein n=1 Tax=Paenibacillus TaxID=44249 RepID=UPI000B58CC2E|nr:MULTISPECIES: hypothetical protein [Paenibacillus]
MESPVTVDIGIYCDGIDLKEIIYALNITAEGLSGSNAFRSQYMQLIAKKIEKVSIQRGTALYEQLEKKHLL